MGSFVILLTILAFTAGKLRNELALTLLGTVFLIILIYCFLGVFSLGVIRRRNLQLLSLTITNETVPVGTEGEVCISFGAAPLAKYFWHLPAILIRCELCLETRDGRVIRCFIDPSFEKHSSFPVRERGAYYSGSGSQKYDRLVIFDALGFFRVNLPIRQNGNPRLLAVPSPAEEGISLSLKAGGYEERYEDHYRKSDELISHRPYVPGDDPRRINWKLYSHAPLGDLFVREGESEPPPHSRLLILIDTEADFSLFSLDEARRAVDLLCENALASALEFSGRGMDIFLGYTGGKILGGSEESAPMNPSQLASAMALPAALLWASLPRAELPRADLPRAPGDAAVLVLALPRALSGTSALDRFLQNREPSTSQQGTDVVFLYNGQSARAAELSEAAALCANLYRGRSGVHTAIAAVAPGARK